MNNVEEREEGILDKRFGNRGKEGLIEQLQYWSLIIGQE
jgi:hypothetical protein